MQTGKRVILIHQRTAGGSEVAGRGGIGKADLAIEGEVFGMLLALDAPGMNRRDGIDLGVIAGRAI